MVKWGGGGVVLFLTFEHGDYTMFLDQQRYDAVLQFWAWCILPVRGQSLGFEVVYVQFHSLPSISRCPVPCQIWRAVASNRQINRAQNTVTTSLFFGVKRRKKIISNKHYYNRYYRLFLNTWIVFSEAKALAEKQMNEAMAMAQGKCVLQ